ncbi:hypothetical protein EO238_24195, partial [Citrobacter sp. AAK_AS5]
MDTAYQASQLLAVIGQAAGVLAAGVTAVILTRRRRRPGAAGLLVVGWCGGLLRDFGQLAVAQMLSFGLFAAWSGLALRDARAAARLLDVVSVAVEGGSDEALLLATDVPTLLEAPSPNGIRLLSFEDLLLTLHGGPGPLARPEDRAR